MWTALYSLQNVSRFIFSWGLYISVDNQGMCYQKQTNKPQNLLYRKKNWFRELRMGPIPSLGQALTSLRPSDFSDPSLAQPPRFPDGTENQGKPENLGKKRECWLPDWATSNRKSPQKDSYCPYCVQCSRHLRGIICF